MPHKQPRAAAASPLPADAPSQIATAKTGGEAATVAETPATAKVTALADLRAALHRKKNFTGSVGVRDIGRQKAPQGGHYRVLAPLAPSRFSDEEILAAVAAAATAR